MTKYLEPGPMKFTYGGSVYSNNYERMFLGLCQCPCHEQGDLKKKLHEDACCKPCPKCKRNVRVGSQTEHKKKCKGTGSA